MISNNYPEYTSNQFFVDNFILNKPCIIKEKPISYINKNSQTQTRTKEKMIILEKEIKRSERRKKREEKRIQEEKAREEEKRKKEEEEKAREEEEKAREKEERRKRRRELIIHIYKLEQLYLKYENEIKVNEILYNDFFVKSWRSNNNEKLEEYIQILKNNIIMMKQMIDHYYETKKMDEELNFIDSYNYWYNTDYKSYHFNC